MKLIRLQIKHKLALFINWIFKSFINRFTFIFSTLLFTFLRFFAISILAIIFLLLLSIIIALTILRTSNNLNINQLTGTLNMSVLNLEEYWTINYFKEKDKIANKLKKEFIEGVLEASNYNNQIKMKTHKWFLENVINDKKVKSKYIVEVIDTNKKMSLGTETLILINPKDLKKHFSELDERLKRKRKEYLVKLTCKEDR